MTNRLLFVQCTNIPLTVPIIAVKWGVPKINIITVLASLEGLEAVAKDHPDVSIILGAIDEDVDANGHLLPGLGDSGDSLFGTPTIDDDESLLHVSKRKRSIESETA